MPLQMEFITKGDPYCKCHVFYSMLVHGPVSGYNSLQQSGETGGLWGDMLRYFCPPASLTTHNNQYSHTTHFLPTKNTRWRTEGCGDCFCWLLYLCCWYKESETERLCSRVLLCCLHRQLTFQGNLIITKMGPNEWMKWSWLTAIPLKTSDTHNTTQCFSNKGNRLAFTYIV